MTDQLFVESRAYLAPTAWSFWSWAAADRVVTWWTGETIAFHPELELVLYGAAPVGLPPLSIVLLVLRRLPRHVGIGLARPANVTRLTSTFQEAKLSMGDMKRLLDGLMRVSHLPSDLRHPPEARVDLLRFLFESGDGCVSADRAGRVCDALARAAPASLEWLFRPVSQARVELETATRELLNGLDRLDEDSLRLRQKTGMDQLLRTAAIDKPSSDRVRDLIGSLQDDDEFHGLARLARAS